MRILHDEGSRNAASHLLESSTHRYGSLAAIVAEAGPHTYDDVLALVNRIGNALRRCGYVPGDRVLLSLADALTFAASFFAALKIGAVPVPVSPESSASELQHYLSDAGPRLALASPASYAALKAAAQERLDVVMVSDWADYDVQAKESWEAFLSNSASTLDGFECPDNHPAVLLYTSGTTARQKGVLHSHRNLIAANRNVGNNVFGFRPTDRVLSMARTSFAFGLGFGMCFPLAAGATIIERPRTQSLEELSQYINLHRPTILAAVPSFLTSLLKAARTWLKVDLSSLRFVASAGEPFSAHLHKDYRDVFGIEVVDGIGSTELLTHFISHRPGHSRPGSCGTVVPGCEVQILRENGEPVAEGEIGALWVKSESGFLEYWNQPERTAQVRPAEWVATGDKLYRDAHGDFIYCGRDDDMVKLSGMWISPRDIEAALCEHPAVERAVVTTREDGYGLRRIVAYAEPVQDDPVTPQQLLRHLGDRLSVHMLPAAILLLPKLPLTPTGKLDRRALPAPPWSVAAG